jgi:hypothetical protein
MRAIAPLAGILVAAGCAPGEPHPSGDGTTDPDAPAETTDGTCGSTAPYCSADLAQVLACDPATGAVTVVEICAPGTYCIDASCVAAACPPGSTECVDESNARVCRPDGSGWDIVPCPSRERCNEETGLCEVPCDLRIFILLDQSGSMGGTTSPTKWEQAREALAVLMSSPAAADVEFGFGVFPDPGDCGTDDIVKHPIPDASAGIVDDYFAAHGPGGNTPLAAALRFFLADTTANLSDMAYHNALLLVSDGSDTCFIDCTTRCGPFDFACLMDCEAHESEWTIDELVAVTSQLRDPIQIRTYVVGFGSGVSDEELTAIAGNGGTVLGDWIPASDVDELSAAFETVLDEMLECNPII